MINRVASWDKIGLAIVVAIPQLRLVYLVPCLGVMTSRIAQWRPQGGTELASESHRLR